MKKGKFETQAEIWEHLLKNKRIAHDLYPSNPVFLENGMLSSKYFFDIPSAWQPYQKPKQKKTIYQAIYKNKIGEYWSPDSFYETEQEAKERNTDKLVYLVPIEIEE